ncbi:putative Histidine kinase [Candidatus Terasakiella magnetica]|uniref:histidine kinase n=1 Tax=Candidatus Terasakiella magnetica TaxID=1867952 RepID=A0A1C3RJA7_9PROT|nr:HAMP domain-containing sensor histidine kinase [Candidatus Terasakiella magnetica]SCA57354.1 putative Histidine kinase [Candidatus Terasakiella magnetica]
MTDQTSKIYKLNFYDRLEVKFLSVFLPLVIFFAVLSILLVEGIDYQKTKVQYKKAQQSITADLLALSGEYLWNLDKRRLGKLIESQLVHPGVTGIIVWDEDAQVFIQQGHQEQGENANLIEEPIYFQTDSAREEIGKIQIFFTDKYIFEAFITRVLQNLPIVLIICISIILGAIYISQQMIKKPLKRMVKAIEETEHDNFPTPISWEKKDEIAMVIHSFNQLMKRRQDLHQENKQLASNLLEAQKIEAIGHLAGGIAHEINTPIQYISSNIHFMNSAQKRYVSFLNSLKDQLSKDSDTQNTEEFNKWVEAKIEELDLDFISEEIDGCLTETTEGLTIISDIVRAMKEFNHSGQKDKSQVDINGCLKRALTISSNQWKHIARVEEQLHDGDCMVMGYYNEINQVILNLIINATHAIEDHKTERKGVLKVTSALNEDHCLITISDNGTGIPKDVQDNIFLPFYTTKEVGRGTGQGLTLCYDMIVNKHKGKIYFETEEGKGTTFFIRLPLR